MIRVTQNRLNGKFVRAWNVDGVATRRAGVTDIVNIYDNQKDPARAKGALGPLPTPGDFDAPGQLTLTAGAYPVGVAKYLTKDISAIVGDWEFTVLCQRSYVEFGVTVTNAAGDKSVSILQRNTSFNNAVYRQTSFSGTVLAASFNDAAIYQSTDPIYYKVKKVIS